MLNLQQEYCQRIPMSILLIYKHMLIITTAYFSHIPRPHVRREDAISKLLNKVEFGDHLPLFSDIYRHPTLSFH